MDLEVLDRGIELRDLISETKSDIAKVEKGFDLLASPYSDAHINVGTFNEKVIIQLTREESFSALAHISKLKRKTLMDAEREFAEL